MNGRGVSQDEEKLYLGKGDWGGVSEKITDTWDGSIPMV
jgi:hypothetical protein